MIVSAAALVISRPARVDPVKAHHVDIGMRRQLASDARAVTVHEVEDTGLQAGLVHDFREDEPRESGAISEGFKTHLWYSPPAAPG